MQLLSKLKYVRSRSRCVNREYDASSNSIVRSTWYSMKRASEIHVAKISVNFHEKASMNSA